MNWVMYAIMIACVCGTCLLCVHIGVNLCSIRARDTVTVANVHTVSQKKILNTSHVMSMGLRAEQEKPIALFNQIHFLGQWDQTEIL